jgi:putative endonuclease
MSKYDIINGCPAVIIQKIMFYTYILESIKTKNLYVGYTVDLRRRFEEHNQGLNVSTRPYAPWKIIYYEACLNENDAKRRERYFKKSEGRKTFKLRLREYFHDN